MAKKNELAVVRTPLSSEIVEQVLLNGDLSKLKPEERLSYYKNVCEGIGLNPLTKPFDYINLNGKLTLYALKTATDQLRKLHKVSVIDLTVKVEAGCIVATAKGQDGQGRTDCSTGAVSSQDKMGIGLKGEAYANAIMKAETKAKRRLTLSLCGLGMLDETEVTTIPGVKIGEPTVDVQVATTPEAKAEAVADMKAAAPEPTGDKKTAAAMKAIHAMLKTLGIEVDQFHAYVHKVWEVGSMKDLSIEKLTEIVKILRDFEKGLAEENTGTIRAIADFKAICKKQKTDEVANGAK